MNVFDKILSLALIEDLTETPWWTDCVFRALEEDASNEPSYDAETADPAGQLTSEGWSRVASRRKAL